MRVFCDHLTYEIPYGGPDIFGGRLLELDLAGATKWEVNKMMPFEGSHSSKVHVKTVDKHTAYGLTRVLYVRGNPLKYFQGHNLWGTPDIQSLIYDMTIEIMQIVGHQCMSTHKILRSDMRHVKLKRIDLTAMYELPTLSDVRQWLRSAVYTASGKNQKTSASKTSLYLGQFSESFTLLAYCKYDEMQDHKLPDSFSPEQYSYLQKWAENKLRIECKFRRLKLVQMEMESASKWDYQTVQAVFYNTLKQKLILAGDFAMIPEQIEQLEKKYQRIYHQWNGGADILELTSKTTAYRYRKFFINQFGIDILKQRPNLNANVVPLIRVLEAVPASIPEQAYNMGLVYRPNSERG